MDAAYQSFDVVAASVSIFLDQYLQQVQKIPV